MWNTFCTPPIYNCIKAEQFSSVEPAYTYDIANNHTLFPGRFFTFSLRGSARSERFKRPNQFSGTS
jgi:hypothetical protein